MKTTIKLERLSAMQAQLDDARRILEMIAEMPASTHAVDAALCREWLEENPPLTVDEMSK